MNETDRLRLPLLAAGQAQKEVTHNEALLALDGLVQASVVSRQTAAPPAAPAAGDGWIVAAAPTGAWSGQAGRIARWDGGGWAFRAPFAGLLAWVADEQVFAVFRDGLWDTRWPTQALRIGTRTVMGATPVAIADPVGGTGVDTEARAAIVQIIAALRSQGLIV